MKYDITDILSFSFITAFLVCFFAIPAIIRAAKAKNLYDEPGIRNSHSEKVPRLGGLAIFAAMVSSITFWTDFTICPHLQFIIAAMTVMTLIGINDDVVGLSPFRKTVGMVFAAMIVVIWGNIRITEMYSIFGIQVLPEIISILFTILTLIVIINAFNMVDGINGLASSMGIISALIFGIWFYLVKDYQHAIIAFSLVAALLAFLRYNVTPAKIFMGDTGSLLIGLIIAVLAVEFIKLNGPYTGNPEVKSSPYFIKSAPVVAIGIIFIPLFDLLRVFIFRILRKRSPFRADKTHMHHILLKFGNSHMMATAILSFFSVVFIVVSFGLNFLGSYYLGAILIASSLLLTFIPYYMLRRTKNNGNGNGNKS